MIINFDKVEEKTIDGFKGGNGPFIMRAIDDGKVKIMRNILPPGSAIGTHTHEGNYEMMYVIRGEMTFVYDGTEETAKAGEVHYCPSDHTHRAENRTDEDAEFLAVVADVM